MTHSVCWVPTTRPMVSAECLQHDPRCLLSTYNRVHGICWEPTTRSTVSAECLQHYPQCLLRRAYNTIHGVCCVPTTQPMVSVECLQQDPRCLLSAHNRVHGVCWVPTTGSTVSAKCLQNNSASVVMAGMGMIEHTGKLKGFPVRQSWVLILVLLPLPYFLNFANLFSFRKSTPSPKNSVKKYLYAVLCSWNNLGHYTLSIWHLYTSLLKIISSK